jgi:hypothetical protein
MEALQQIIGMGPLVQVVRADMEGVTDTLGMIRGVWVEVWERGQDTDLQHRTRGISALHFLEA